MMTRTQRRSRLERVSSKNSWRRERRDALCLRQRVAQVSEAEGAGKLYMYLNKVHENKEESHF